MSVKYDVGGETKEAPDKLVVALPPFTPLVALSSPAASSKEQQPKPALSSPGNRSAFVRPGVDYARAVQNNNNKRLLSTQSTPTKSAWSYEQLALHEKSLGQVPGGELQ